MISEAYMLKMIKFVMILLSESESAVLGIELKITLKLLVFQRWLILSAIAIMENNIVGID